jgi:peroxiredoxin
MAMFRSLFLLLLCSLALINAQAVKIPVSGVAEGFPNSELYFVVHHDEFTRTPHIMAEASTDGEGRFAATLDLESSRLITVYVSSWSAAFYVEAGRSYTIRLAKPQPRTAKRFANNPLEVFFTDLASDDPNAVMAAFTMRYDALFGDLALDLAVRLGKGSTEALRPDSAAYEEVDLNLRFTQLADSMYAMLSPVSDPFTHDLLRGALGQLDLALGQQKAHIDSVWLGEAPDVNNPEMVALFYAMHAHALESNDVNEQGFLAAIERSDVALAREALQRYLYLRTDEERLLFMVMMAQQFAERSSQARVQAMAFLERIQSEGEGDVHALAGRMRGELGRGTTKAIPFFPDLTLMNHVGDRVKLREMEGEWIYLSVVLLNSPGCERELGVMENLVKKFGREVRFVTLIIDGTDEAMRNYLSKHRNREWEFLQGTHHPVLRHDLRISTVPCFFLIGPDGRLVADYTPSPSEGAHDVLLRMTRTSPKRVKVWD